MIVGTRPGLVTASRDYLVPVLDVSNLLTLALPTAELAQRHSGTIAFTRLSRPRHRLYIGPSPRILRAKWIYILRLLSTRLVQDLHAAFLRH